MNDPSPSRDLTPYVVGGIATEPPGDELARHTAAWIWSYRESAGTREAYQRDIEAWAAWCAEHNVDPRTALRPVIDAYAATLATMPTPKTGRPLAPASVARKLSAVSSWYDYLVSVGVVAINPCKSVRRPKIDKDYSATVALTAAEATALRHAAGNDRVLGTRCGAALAGFLVELGARVSEVCALDIADLGYDSGHRTVKLRMKGSKTRTRAVPPDLAEAIDLYLDERADAAGIPRDELAGPLFVTSRGRIDRFEVGSFVRRNARTAGVAAWAKITPHSFRHAWATIARERGATLEERQYALGHADPRTTQRYDRARASLERDPSYLVAAATAGGAS